MEVTWPPEVSTRGTVLFFKSMTNDKHAYYSIKILDVERMVAKASLPMDMGNQSDASAAVDHPVIRTLYDHLEEVTTLAFHPFEQKLISGSKDYTIKIFDWSRSSAKKAQHTIQEVEWIRCLSLHPSGDWLVGKFFSHFRNVHIANMILVFVGHINFGKNKIARAKRSETIFSRK